MSMNMSMDADSIAQPHSHTHSHSHSMTEQENIRVCFRVRPLDRRERECGEWVAWKIDVNNATMRRKTSQHADSEDEEESEWDDGNVTGMDMNMSMMSNNGRANASRTKVGSNAAKSVQQREFACSTLFDDHATTEELYDRQVRDIVTSSMKGINATIMAYGQTSSGKTHTIKGSSSCPGVIPLALRQVFDHIRSCKDHDFLLRVSYIEIYNERVKDLLDPESGLDLPIHESKSRGVHVAAREVIVKDEEEVLTLLNQGEGHRHYGRTEMNDLSSRSHTILRLFIESSPVEQKDSSSKGMNSARQRAKAKAKARAKVKVSQLNFVDLAGSERLSQTKARVGGAVQKEGAYINKSLMFLGVIISRLSEGDKESHLPFRDSKLTRLLQSSLGGNARTSIVCTLSPSSGNVEQSVSTLRFGARAIRIRNHARVNEVSAESALISKQQLNIKQLEERLDSIKQREKEEEERENERAWETEKMLERAAAAADTLRLKEELEAKLARLRALILHSTDAPVSGPVPGEQVGPHASSSASSSRRRHTLATLPTHDKSHMHAYTYTLASSPSSSAIRFCAEQQVNAQNNKIAQLEELLAELSAENQEMIKNESDSIAQQEALTCEIEELSEANSHLTHELASWRCEDGLEELSDEELVRQKERLQQAMERVEKQMHFNEFKRIYMSEGAMAGNDNANPIPSPSQVAASAAIAAEAAERERRIHELEAMLEESTRASSAIRAEMESERARWEDEREIMKLEQKEKESKASAEVEAQMAAISDLRERCTRQANEISSLRDQTYKYSKQLLAVNANTNANTNTNINAQPNPVVAEPAASTQPRTVPSFNTSVDVSGDEHDAANDENVPTHVHDHDAEQSAITIINTPVQKRTTPQDSMDHHQSSTAGAATQPLRILDSSLNSTPMVSAPASVPQKKTALSDMLQLKSPLNLPRTNEKSSAQTQNSLLATIMKRA